ncbi:hypothetical protein Pyrde_0141 [Pyrodictium delaneyi]|nr:hypothetical protein Pyrde_0141 [Pyrodictium delaneyi]
MISMESLGLEEAIERARILLEAVSRGEYCCLRFGLPYVTPSLLASQVFCEKKLEYSLLNESEDEKAKRVSEARKLVEVLLEARRHLPRQLDRFTLSFPVAAVVEGVPIIGRPHAVYFEDGHVAAIVLGKITMRPSKLYDSDRVKLYAYALTLAYAGFPLTSRTRLVLVAAKDNKKLIDALSSLDPGSARPFRGDGAAIHVLAHDVHVELETVSNLLAYWKGNRASTARQGPWCSSCPFRELCKN